MHSVGVVGVIFQNITYSVTVPLWIFLHLLTSPVAKGGSHANTIVSVSPLDLKILPFSIILGYILPAILMGLPSPSVVSTVQRQRLIALWQPFPIWCVIIQTIISTALGGRAKNHDSQARNWNSYLKAAQGVYTFVTALCVVTHLPVLLLTILPQSVFPATSHHLQYLSAQSFSWVYVPYLPSLSHQVPSFAAGVHLFLQWDLYIGGTALLMWGILLERNTTAEKVALGGKGESWARLLSRVTLRMVLAGPVGSLAMLLWERDSIVEGKTNNKL